MTWEIIKHNAMAQLLATLERLFLRALLSLAGTVEQVHVC